VKQIKEARCAEAICLLGAAWRILFFLFDKNLWLDEATVSLNIVRRTFLGLCSPLDYGQMAPLGFLWLTKAAITVFGDYDLVFRLPELVASLAALFLFYHLVGEALPEGGPAAWFALGLFALNPALMQFTCQVKPYEIDAFAATALLLIGTRLLRRWQGRDAVLLGIIGSGFAWFSYTSCFVLGAAGLVVGLQTLRARQWRRFAAVAAAVSVATLNVLAHYYFFNRHSAASMLKLPMHQETLLQLIPRNLAELRLDLNLLGRSIVFPGGYIVPGAGLLLLGLATLEISRKRSLPGALLAATVVVGIFGCIAVKYPWNGRLILFIVPVACLAGGFGIRFLGEGMEASRFRPTAILLAALTLFPPALNHFARTVEPFNNQGTSSVMEQISRRIAPGTPILIDPFSTPVFQFYDRRAGFSSRFRVIGANAYSEDEALSASQVRALTGKGKVWIFFPDYFIGGTEHPQRVLALLDSIGRRVDAIELFTSKAYLYDL
jgi:hypothetical protein